MSEKPILFSTQMVQAIIQGRKKQTRRIVKPQPNDAGVDYMKNPPLDWENVYKEEWKPFMWDTEEGERIARHPKGYLGDTLWVRESFAKVLDHNGVFSHYAYKADEDPLHTICKWKPSRYMPRAAARIFLEITGVRVERLRKISILDCIAEGIESPSGHPYGFKNYLSANGEPFGGADLSYKSLWESINGEQSWLDNPWVWVIEFKQKEGK